MTVSAIIPAAGQGVRMGGDTPKQFLAIQGKPVLDHTLKVFQECGVVDSVTLVAPEKELEDTRARWLNSPPVVKQVVLGGEKRQDSVCNGFQALDPKTEIVIVHDGVRPFVAAELIRAMVQAAREHGAAIAAVPVSDTLKKDNGLGFVERTVDREQLWRVQTPQAFRYDILREAFERAQADKFYGTDESSLVERLGREIKIVMGSELNIKITRPEDLVLGEAIAARHGLRS